MSNPLFYRYSFFVTLFALIVIVLGAFVRLSDAGLGCPDWPGCYGLIDVPQTEVEVKVAEQAFPQRPVEIGKAWKEMFHRYFAGTLGLLIVGLAIMSYKIHSSVRWVRPLSVGLVGLVIFQALLGMWTVTLQVKPAIVTLHLIFGMTTAVLLWLVTLNAAKDKLSNYQPSGFRTLAWIGLVIVVFQIALGGWTSTNYAALACTAFPGCYSGEAWPAMDFAEGFVLWRGLGVNYEFGVLEADARAAIHMVHRLGAVVVLVLIAFLGIQGWRNSSGLQRQVSIAMLVVLTIQVLLGINNVVSSLPLLNAVAHNGVAALLLMTIVTFIFLEYKDIKET